MITQGTGEGGEYTIASALISDTSSSETSFTGVTLPNLITPIAVTVSNEQNSIETKSLDVTAPTFQVVSPENKDYVKGEKILINATATDSQSVVSSSEIKLNGVVVKNGEIFDTTNQKLGSYRLVFSAVDSVGNSASSTVNFRIIASVKNMIDDVERLFSLGFITNKTIKDELVLRLNQILRLEKIGYKRTEIKYRDRFDKITIYGRWLLADIERYHPKFIDDASYNLLVEGIKWIMYK